MSAVTLIVIAKEPVPGKAKTRLAPAVGPDGAAALAEAALADTLDVIAEAARRGGHPILLALDGKPGPWMPQTNGITVVPQRGDGLGERLAAAFTDAGGPALLVGMDTPQITPALIADAVARLGEPGCDSVLGLASDGGWWALGLRAPDPAVFDGVPMSADDTGERQLAALRARGLDPQPLPLLTDVDDIETARSVAAEAPGTRFAAELRRRDGATARPSSPRPSHVPRLAALLAVLALVALLAAGCGSDDEFPPPAEPAASPRPTTDPAGTVLKLPGGAEAEGVIADPETGIVGVVTRDPDKMVLVGGLLPAPTGAATRRPEVRRVKLPESARHAQLAAPGGPILTTAEYTDDLIEVSLPEGDVETVTVGDFPHDATQAADGRIWVGDEGGDTVSIVEDGRVTNTLPAPIQPGGIAATDERVAVVAVSERVLSTWDSDTMEPTGEVEAGVGPTHIVAGPDGRLYVADTQGDAILVFDAADDDGEPRLLDRANLPGQPYGLALDPEREMLWVTQTDRNRVVGFELTDLAPKRVVSYPTVQQPNTVAVDSATGIVYVVGRTSGELQAIDPRSEPGDS